MIICSPISALYAVLASIISILTSMSLGVPATEIYSGLWNENAIITATALGGVFFVANSRKHAVFTLMGAIFSTVIHGATLQMMTPFGLPTMNLSFHVTTWCWCLAGKTI